MNNKIYVTQTCPNVESFMWTNDINITISLDYYNKN